MQTIARSETLYLLDANVLIDAQRDYYPFDMVPEFWDWLVHMAQQGTIKVPQEVYDTLTGDNRDDLSEWLKSNKSALLFEEEVDIEIFNRVLEQGYTADDPDAPDLTESEIAILNQDPFLIAYALADAGQRCVVTTEVSRPNRKRANRHIPDVCRELGVSCCNTFTLLRELDFRTDWNR